MKLIDLFENGYYSRKSEQEQLETIEVDPNYIKRIKNPSEAVQLAAVKRNLYIIEYLINKGINPSEAVQLAAVQQDGYVIYHINNPSEVVQLAAVQQNGYAIEYIDNPSERVKLAAVTENGHAIERIDNPSKQVIFTVLTNHNFIQNNNKYHGYDSAVRKLFPNSSILVDKWIKYGNRVRASLKKGKL